MSAPSQINISIKMLNGDLIPLGIPSNITVKQFYRMVWQLIPTQIPLQSLDLFRGDDSELPLPHTPMPLLPEQDEIFYAFIQLSHFTLRLELVADAFDQQSNYQAFEVVIHESHSDVEESKSNPPSIVNFSLPHTQDGNLVKPSHRYNTYRVTFFAQTHLDSKGKVSRESTHTFYSEENIQILRSGRYGDEWEIHIPEDKQSLYQLTDILHSLPLSERTLHKLSEVLQNEWNDFFSMSLGCQIEEIPLDDDLLQAAFEFDQADQGDD
jgi:hypothetical protein